MSRTFAWILFITSVIAFAVEFRANQVAMAFERANIEAAIPLNDDEAWCAADVGEEL